MPSKNDLSAFKASKQEAPILPVKPAASQEGQGATQTTTKSRAKTKTKTIGRPKKPAAEKRDYKITLSLTQAEGALVREKAGIAADAAYLYQLLERAGAFR